MRQHLQIIYEIGRELESKLRNIYYSIKKTTEFKNAQKSQPAFLQRCTNGQPIVYEKMHDIFNQQENAN